MDDEISELICNQVFVSRTDDRTCLVGGGCIKWKPHYLCYDDSCGVGINTTSLAPRLPDPLQEADVSKPSIMMKWNLHQKSQQEGGREDNDGYSRTLSLEAVYSVFVVMLRCCDLTAFFCPSCVCLMFISSWDNRPSLLLDRSCELCYFHPSSPLFLQHYPPLDP